MPSQSLRRGRHVREADARLGVHVEEQRPQQGQQQREQEQRGSEHEAGDLSRFLNSFMSLASRLHGTDARVEQADQHVGAEVGDQHRDRDEQRSSR